MFRLYACITPELMPWGGLMQQIYALSSQLFGMICVGAADLGPRSAEVLQGCDLVLVILIPAKVEVLRDLGVVHQRIPPMPFQGHKHPCMMHGAA